MSFAYEVGSDLLENGTEEYTEDYENFFEEEDFEALGVNPKGATEAKPGSEDKVMMLAARYAAGLPLWHDKDCYDHGPGRKELQSEI